MSWATRRIYGMAYIFVPSNLHLKLCEAKQQHNVEESGVVHPTSIWFLAMSNTSTAAQGGGRMWKRDQHSLFFFSEFCLTPPHPHLPNRVCFSHTYVFSFFEFKRFTCNKYWNNYTQTVGQSFIKDPYHGPATADSNVGTTSMLKRLRYLFKDVCG